MTDQSKRRLLKLVSGNVIAHTLLQSSDALSREHTDTSIHQSLLKSSNEDLRGELDITIISSPDVSDDSLILSNLSQRPIDIHGFAGGTIVFRDKQINLSTLAHPLSLSAQPLHIRAKGHLSMPIAITQRDSSDQIVEYIWAEDSTTCLSQGTLIVSLGAFMAGDIAVQFTRVPRPLA